jgi:hypothetical protein
MYICHLSIWHPVQLFSPLLCLGEIATEAETEVFAVAGAEKEW